MVLVLPVSDDVKVLGRQLESCQC